MVLICEFRRHELILCAHCHDEIQHSMATTIILKHVKFEHVNYRNHPTALIRRHASLYVFFFIRTLIDAQIPTSIIYTHVRVPSSYMLNK